MIEKLLGVLGIHGVDSYVRMAPATDERVSIHMKEKPLRISIFGIWEMNLNLPSTGRERVTTIHAPTLHNALDVQEEPIAGRD
jgi:hypothetical protein